MEEKLSKSMSLMYEHNIVCLIPKKSLLGNRLLTYLGRANIGLEKHQTSAGTLCKEIVESWLIDHPEKWSDKKSKT
jgi:hypothetical protein